MNSKIKEIIDKHHFRINDYSRYNDLFKLNIIAYGNYICIDDKVKEITKTNNKYKCTINGTQKYNVSVELDDNHNFINGTCECMYYKNTDHHCKHIYALLKTIELEDFKQELNDTLSLIKVDISNTFTEIEKINKEYDSKVKNKKLKEMIQKELLKRNTNYQEILNKINNITNIYHRDYIWYCYKLEEYKDDLKELKVEINDRLKNQFESEENSRKWKEECKIGDLSLVELIESKHNFTFKHIDESYVDDRIKEEIEYSDDIGELSLCKKLMIKYKFDTKQINKRIKQVKKDNEELERDTNNFMINFASSLLDQMDIKSVNQLQKTMNQNVGDTKWIDEYKVIRARREREEAKLEHQYSIMKKLIIFNSIMDAFSSSSKSSSFKDDISFLAPWEQEAVRKGEFNLWDFEEEEMDEENYYYEDLD